MPPHLAVPSLLAPYTSPLPSSSLTLLTSTLSANTNWLVLRFIHAALKSSDSHREPAGSGVISDGQQTRVVLASWLRDVNWWKDGARKLGVDTRKLQVVDALSSDLGFSDRARVDAEKDIVQSVKTFKKATSDDAQVLLVLDGLDFLLAASGCSAQDILEMVRELREHVHATVVTSCADLPLIQSSTTPLEVSHAAFIISLVHQARLVMSVRGLNTGGAKDVSGVLRVTRGAGLTMDDGELEEKECLYFVRGDGGVKVIERGA